MSNLKCLVLSGVFSEHSMVIVKMAWLRDEWAFMLVGPTLLFLLPTTLKIVCASEGCRKAKIFLSDAQLDT